jgi:hypothetical protein
MQTLNSASDKSVFKLSVPSMLVRLESLTALVITLVLYWRTGGNGWLFAVLLLAPDLSMVGYMRNAVLGSAMYNAAHTLIVPALLLAIMLVLESLIGVHIALIWFAHIFMDRTVGYGLKYAAGFKQTHLNRI